MHEQDPRQQRRDTDYEETVAPENPPASVLRPEARKAWWASSFGVVTAIFLVVALVYAFVLIRNSADGEAGHPPEPAAPTSGQTDTPGADDDSKFGETEDELEFRGTDDQK